MHALEVAMVVRGACETFAAALAPIVVATGVILQVLAETRGTGERLVAHTAHVCLRFSNRARPLPNNVSGAESLKSQNVIQPSTDVKSFLKSTILIGNTSTLVCYPNPCKS